jgi:hypothetical protein
MKIAKLLLLSLSIIFLSCSDDEDPKPTSEGMVGTWNITAVEYTGTTTSSILGQTIKADFTGTGKDMDLTSTFGMNPNTVVSAGGYTITLKTTVAGQTTTEDVPVDDFVSDGTWSLSGNTLTITDDFGTEDATIIQQTATTLKMRIDIDETESDLGFTVTTKVRTIFTFAKQ